MKQFFTIVSNEIRFIIHDSGVMLILIFAPIIYATIYSLTYGTQVLRNIPIAVIDNDKTASSRRLTNILGMGANAIVAYEPTDMAEAKRLFYNRNIYGIAYIPNGYERQLMGGEQTTIAVYLDASYMLMYRQVFQDLVEGINTTGAVVEFQHLIANGIEQPQARAIVQPVKYTSHTLFNPYLGYGSFIMPPVLILILQQTLLIGIGMIGGTWYERGLYRKFTIGQNKSRGARSLLAGKAFTYFIVYAILSLYLFCVHYRLFHYPANGKTIHITLFMSIYLLSCIFVSIALSTLFRRRETPLMTFLWSSIPLLMLSGASFPSSAIPRLLDFVAVIFPSTLGIRGFVKIQTMGASLEDIIPELSALITQTIIYGSLAYIGIRRVLNKKSSKRDKISNN